MVPFYILNAIFDFSFMSVTATSMGIAVVNTVYKVLATVIEAPFAGLLEKLAVTTIKVKKSEEDDEDEDNLLDERFLEYPPLALEQSGRTMQQMSTAAFKNFTKSIELLSVFNQEKYDKVMLREDRVDKYEDRIGSYMVRIHKQELSDEETQTSAKYLAYLSNVERISDHAVNLAELAQELHSKKISFSPRATKELRVCIDAVCEIAELTKLAMQENNLDAARKVEPLEEVIDVLTKELKGCHVQRVQAGQCTLELGFIFNDCINNLERVADHCSNIAVAVLEAKDSHPYAHDYMHSLNQSSQEKFREQFNVYARQYYDALGEHE